MEVWHVRCGGCGYETKLSLGSTDLDQTYSDLNEDFAFFKLFTCKSEKVFVAVNIHDRHFHGRCPADGSELVPAEVPPSACPRCGAKIAHKRLDINAMLGGE